MSVSLVAYNGSRADFRGRVRNAINQMSTEMSK